MSNVNDSFHYRFCPIGEGSNVLNTIDLKNNEDKVIVLGRNDITGLLQQVTNVQYVSRKHLEIKMNNGILLMKPLAKQDGLVYLNGNRCEKQHIRLTHGDVISLLGTLNYFNFQIQRVERDDTNNSTTIRTSSDQLDDRANILLIHPSKRRRLDESLPVAPTLPLTSNETADEVICIQPTHECLDLTHSPTPAVKKENPATKVIKSPSASHEDHLTSILRQFECSICYDTMACVFSLSPCGDCFCYECIHQWTQDHSTCPLCQGSFDLKASILNKTMDNVVREILKPNQKISHLWEERAAAGLLLWKERQSVNTGSSVPRISRLDMPYRFIQNRNTDSNNNINNNIREQMLARRANRRNTRRNALHLATPPPPPVPATVLHAAPAVVLSDRNPVAVNLRPLNDPFVDLTNPNTRPAPPVNGMESAVQGVMQRASRPTSSGSGSSLRSPPGPQGSVNALHLAVLPSSQSTANRYQIYSLQRSAGEAIRLIPMALGYSDLQRLPARSSSSSGANESRICGLCGLEFNMVDAPVVVGLFLQQLLYDPRFAETGSRSIPAQQRLENVKLCNSLNHVQCVREYNQSCMTDRFRPVNPLEDKRVVRFDQIRYKEFLQLTELNHLQLLSDW